MQSLRRVAVRSAASAARAVATKPQTRPIAAQLAHNISAARVCAAPIARFFSQTALRASEEHEAAESASPAVDPLAQGPETPHGVFVRNIVFDATEQHLKEAFEKYGAISKVAIARDARSLSRGFGFIFFETAEAAEKACEVNGMFWHGRRIAVQPRSPPDSSKGRRGGRSPRGNKEPTNSLYIGNIPYETTDADLNGIFKDLENVTAVRVAVDRTTGWPRGFAHADFVDVEACKKAMDKLSGTKIGDRELRFDFAEHASGRLEATKKPNVHDTPPDVKPPTSE